MNEEQAAREAAPENGADAQVKTGIPFSSHDELDPEQYLRRAKSIVQTFLFGEGDKADEIYIVWYSKTLKNWKALVSTSIPDGRYYEVTYDGEKRQAYLDVYVKTENMVFRDRD